MKVSEHLRKASSQRRAFNKYNAVELLSQLMGVLEQEGLDDAVAALKKVTPVINKAWSKRAK